MANDKLSESMRDHVEIMIKQIEEAADDTDAAGAICNAFVFLMRESGIDPHAWVSESMEICDCVEAAAEAVAAEEGL